MGNSSSGALGQQQRGFAKWELGLLEKMFTDLARKTQGKAIDKATFLQLFNLPGMVGERLFAVFDVKKNGRVEFDEFISGLRAYSRGSMEEKVHMLFKMYDMSGNEVIDAQELSMMLFSLLTPTALIDPKNSSSAVAKKTQESVSKIVKQAFEECDSDKNGKLSFLEFKNWILSHPEITEKLEEVLVRHSWESLIHDFSDRNRTSPDIAGFHKKSDGNAQGRNSVNSPPDVALTSIYKCSNCKWELHFCYACGGKVNSETLACPNCGPVFTKKKLINCMNCNSLIERKDIKPVTNSGSGGRLSLSFGRLPRVSSKNQLASNASPPVPPKLQPNTSMVIRSGFLTKRGSLIKTLKKRWFVLTSNFLYMFKKEFDEHPSRIIFIEGCYIEYELVDDEAKSGQFGFEIIRGDELDSQNKTVLYAKTKEERQQWVSDLRKSAKTVPITDLYDFGEQVGKGKFSVVHIGYEKSTGQKYAIKVLDKKKIDESEKESLRQEIAILNVVRHPRIVQMKEVFETPEKIYIILRLYENGDLFRYIRNLKTRLAEHTVKRIVWNLIDTVMYLHSLGIVHRDLKPENILLDDPNDCTKIVLSDFGLSKFATPQEIMKTACGTLSYVAPEVLRLAGYTKAVDYWSIGVIMYLLLSGYLPFSGKSEQDTISQTLKAEVKFNQPSWKSISQDARILVARLLRNDPSQRPTGEKIISHPWFDEIRSEMEREAKKEMENRGNLALRLSSSLSVGGVSESNSGEFQPSNPKQEISSNSPKKLPDLSSAASSDNSPENSEIKQ